MRTIAIVELITCGRIFFRLRGIRFTGRKLRSFRRRRKCRDLGRTRTLAV